MLFVFPSLETVQSGPVGCERKLSGALSSACWVLAPPPQALSCFRLREVCTAPSPPEAHSPGSMLPDRCDHVLGPDRCPVGKSEREPGKHVAMVRSHLYSHRVGLFSSQTCSSPDRVLLREPCCGTDRLPFRTARAVSPTSGASEDGARGARASSPRPGASSVLSLQGGGGGRRAAGEAETESTGGGSLDQSRAGALTSSLVSPTESATTTR